MRNRAERVGALQMERRLVGLPLQLPSLDEMRQAASDKRQLLREFPPEDNSEDARWARFYAPWSEQMAGKLGAGPTPEMVQEIQAMRIGEVALVFLPGEVFCEFGMEIKERSPFDATVVVGYANDFPGYIPSHREFEVGAYSAHMVPKICGNFPFRPDVGAVLCDAAVGALGALA